MANAIIGHGLQFELGAGAGPTYTPINGILSVEYGSSKVDIVDSTDMGTAGTGRAFIAGLKDSGEATVKGNFIPAEATQVQLRNAMDSATHPFKVIYPSALATETFSGIIQSFDKSLDDTKPMTFTCKIKITGDITVA